jgi:two-component system, CAI-1 autoinducer sensor kinase/phosphatase CqsS
MKYLRKLFQQFRDYHSSDQPIIQYSGMIGAAAFPLFYLLRFTKAEAPFNDIGLRVIATLFCVGLAMRNHWPKRWQPYFFAYAYVALFFCMPFFWVFTSLVNGGGAIGVANTLMAAVFLVLLSDWRNTVLIFVLGSATATAAYVALVPDAHMPRDYLPRLPILMLIIVGASAFKFAEKKAESAKVKRTYSALAGSIAHEMRNPLSQIKHSLERMQRALPRPTAGAQPQPIPAVQLEALYRDLAESDLAVNRGLQVIAMTLDEVSDKPMDPAGFSLLSAADVVHKAVREYGWDSEQDRARVGVHVIDDFRFRGDETAYLFVLFNLIKNSLHGMALRDRARLSLIVERQQVRVLDNGPGIAPEIRDHLFEPFHSAGKAGGTGLGLSYCHRVMLGFGGSISCQSVLGESTQFTMRFPVVDEREGELSRNAALAQAAAAVRGKRLLIVDDDAIHRMAARNKLRPFDLTVDEAADGHAALEMLGEQHYDLVLLDLSMPGLDGYGVAQRLRAGDALASHEARIVAFTSEPEHLARIKSQKAGMNGFVNKPCDALTLLGALQQAIEQPLGAQVDGSSTLAGCRILLAEDNPYNRKAIAAYLKHAGAIVGEAVHGQSVLDQLHGQAEWDAIVMDLSMPGMGGIEATRAIRDSEAPWREIPIIALTAYSDTETIASARSAGMDDFITKPVDAGVLFAKLAAFLDGRVRLPATTPIEPGGEAAQPETELLNLERLASYERIGMLEELLNDFLPEISRLVERLEDAVRAGDLTQGVDVMHSLLGMSGEAGATALYQLVRRVYVPMVEERRWPESDAWQLELKSLAAQTEEALKAHGAMQMAMKAG